MRISHKLTWAIASGITAVLAVYGYVRVQRELALFEDDMRRDHEVLAHALALSAVVVAERSGADELAHFIEGANSHEEHILIKWMPGSAVTRDSRDSTARRFGQQARSHLTAASGHDPGALMTEIPIVVNDITGRIVLIESLSDEREYIRATIVRVATVLFVIIGFCVAIIVGFGWLFVGRPLQQLMDKIKRVGEGDLSTPLVLSQRDEMRELADEINNMCDGISAANQRAEHESELKIAAVEQLRHAERLSTIGKLASGVAHEIGTPLNVVTARAKMIVRGESQAGEALEDARVIADQSERIARIIRQLLDFARGRRPQKAPEDLVRIAESAVSLLGQMANKRGVTLEMAPKTVRAAPLHVDSGQIQQVLINLVMNAIDALPHGGRITLSVGLSDDGQDYLLSVSDTGIGMPPEVSARVFEPFFTTKDVGQGTGLGLSVAHGIVQEHGGSITVTTEVAVGSCFTVTLPRSA